MRDHFIMNHYRCSVCRIEVSYTQYANEDMVQSGKCYKHYVEECGTMDT